jgi:hypothetical protein
VAVTGERGGHPRPPGDLLSILAVGAAGLLGALLFIWRYTAGKDASPLVVAWWAILCGVSAANVRAWLVSRREFHARMRHSPRLHHRTRIWQVPLSGVFVAVCAIRACFPRTGVARIVLYDGWISSVLIGRSLATVAELCFMGQLSLILWEVSRHGEKKLGMGVARTIIPLIAVAEICSWHAVITTGYLGAVIEESLWGLSSLLLVVAALSNWRDSDRAWKRVLAVLTALGASHVVFETFVDVPMYVRRYQADLAAHKAPVPFLQGIADLARSWVVTYRWEDWKPEIAWLTTYFSVVVWASIWITHAPPPPNEGPLPASDEQDGKKIGSLGAGTRSATPGTT